MNILCPKCTKGSLHRSYDEEVICFSCGYEQILSVPIGQNRNDWGRQKGVGSYYRSDVSTYE